MIVLNKLRSSFSAKVVIWVLLIAIPIFILSVGLLFWQSRKLIRTEAEERANSVLKTAMHRINRYLITAETATNTYAWLAEQSMQPDSLRTYVERLVYLNPYVDGCSVGVEPDVLRQYPKSFMAYSIRDSDSIKTIVDTEINYFHRKWYRTPQSLQKPGWMLYYDETLNKDGMVATYSKPIYNADQLFLGVISSEISLLHLSKIMAEVKPYPHSYYLMIDEQGRYVGHPDSTRLFNKTIFTVADPQKNSDIIALGYEMTEGRQGSMSVVVNGHRSLVCYMPVPKTKWSLAIVCPDSDILYQHNRLTYIVIPLLIIGLLVIIIHSYKTVTVSINPLDLLLEKTKAVADGDMSVDIPHTKSTDVIGGLQNSFSAMLKSLNFYIDSVRKATDQKLQYNKELEQTTQLVIESEKQKTAFIQNVTHQIRTPLNIIMGFSQLLNTPTDDASLSDGLSIDELKNIAGTMNHNTKQLVRMVLMLFDCSETGRAESGSLEMADVDIADAMKEALDYTYNLFPDVKIDYHFNLPEGFSVRTHRRSVVYSVQEVLHNSVKYSDGQNISLTVDKTDDKVRFIIQDTGCGIDEADMDNIYKFFAKIDGFTEGLGLGLPLTKRHAEDLGGDFMLDTTYKEGCRFIFEIPLV
jgi:signal transduction histidine kinase